MYTKHKIIPDHTGLRIDKWFKLNIKKIPQSLVEKLLRIGIAFLGLSLSLVQLFNYGSTAIFLIIINIIVAFLIIKYLIQDLQTAT